MKDSISKIIGDYGEYIFVKRLQCLSEYEKSIHSYNVMKNIKEEKHYFDLFIQKWTINNGIKEIDNSITKIDIKTYKPFDDNYQTGINEHHWIEYNQIPELLIIFIDPLNNCMYGDYIYNMTGSTIECRTGKKTIFYLSDLKPLNHFFHLLKNELTEKEIKNFKYLYNIKGAYTRIDYIEIRNKLKIHF